MNASLDTPTPVTVFYSYAHEDEALLNDLQDHLKILERRGRLAPWHDRKIVPGEDWAKRIDENLRQAELVLLLVSKSFIASDYIFGTELALAMQRQAARQAIVVPILVRAVDLAPEDADTFPFLKLQGLPTNLRAVTSWTNLDEAWADVAKGLRATVEAIIQRRPASPPSPPSSPASADALPRSMPPVTTRGTPAPARDPAAAPDPVLDRVVARFSESVALASQGRGAPPPDASRLRATALRLIDRPDATRVLWVDDQPQGNLHELSALARLQVEVVTVTSTAEAQSRLAGDHYTFDLVISDWQRRGEGAGAGLALLDWLRQHHPALPLVYYHGESATDVRAGRARQAQAHGALGEAVLPDELIALVLRALPGHAPPRPARRGTGARGAC
ncbi:MAG TPA: TIR domain-containing protein [Albitalea sp.]|nr:TIR domain-containing protein [Albitalea sp.]